MNSAGSASKILEKRGLKGWELSWAERLVGMSLSDIAGQRGDLVDFTGSGNVLAAVLEAREAIAVQQAGKEKGASGR